MANEGSYVALGLKVWKSRRWRPPAVPCARAGPHPGVWWLSPLPAEWRGAGGSSGLSFVDEVPEPFRTAVYRTHRRAICCADVSKVLQAFVGTSLTSGESASNHSFVWTSTTDDNSISARPIRSPVSRHCLRQGGQSCAYALASGVRIDMERLCRPNVECLDSERAFRLASLDGYL
jgi:hypothetical protein